MSAFEEAVSSFTDASPWYAAVQEARAAALREHATGGGYSSRQVGHNAWRQLTPVQQANALDELFGAYVMRLHMEEMEQQRDQASATATTYLAGDEEHDLWEVLSAVPRPIEDDATVDKVPARSLGNVLSELDLIRHRLAMATQEGDAR